jgi:hypothetical protein
MAALPLWVRADEQTSQPLHNESCLHGGMMLKGERYLALLYSTASRFSTFKVIGTPSPGGE